MPPSGPAETVAGQDETGRLPERGQVQAVEQKSLPVVRFPPILTTNKAPAQNGWGFSFLFEVGLKGCGSQAGLLVVALMVPDCGRCLRGVERQPAGCSRTYRHHSAGYGARSMIAAGAGSTLEPVFDPNFRTAPDFMAGREQVATLVVVSMLLTLRAQVVT